MKIISFLLLAIAVLVACNQPAPAETEVQKVQSRPYVDWKTAAEKPDIKVQVEGATPGMAYLIGIFQDQQYRVDSAMVDATGSANFKRTTEPYHPGFMFVVFPNNVTLQALVDLDQTFSMRTKIADLNGAMVVEGNTDTELLYQAAKFEDSQRIAFQQNAMNLQPSLKGTPQYQQAKAQQDKLLDDRAAFLNDLFQKHPDSFFTSFKRGGQNPDLRKVIDNTQAFDTARYAFLYRRDFWKGVDLGDDRLLYTPVIANKLKRYITELTAQNPDSVIASATWLVDQVVDQKEYFKYFANWIALQYQPKESKMMDADAVWVHMIQRYFTKERAFWQDSVTTHGLQLQAYEMAASLINKKAPDVVSTDATGKTRSIYEIKSPYIVVYMFNPDCEHCAVETPKLVQWYRTWKPKGAEVYGIAIQTTEKEWKDYIAKQGINFSTVFDPTNKSIYAKYYVDVTPEIYVLNPDRIIIGKNLKVDQIATIIERDKKKRNG